MAINVLGRENRIMIKAIQADIKEIKIGMLDISNHYSKRLPLTATLIITILASLCTGLIVGVLT